MTHLTINTILAAAAVFAAGSASAQTLKADIPFTFQVAGATLAPGTYHVATAQNPTSRYVIIRNAETHASVLARYMSSDVSKGAKSHETATIQFECSGARCALREVWTGSDSLSYHFDGPKLGRDGDTRIAAIRLTAVKAD